MSWVICIVWIGSVVFGVLMVVAAGMNNHIILTFLGTIASLGILFACPARDFRKVWRSIQERWKFARRWRRGEPTPENSPSISPSATVDTSPGVPGETYLPLPDPEGDRAAQGPSLSPFTWAQMEAERHRQQQVYQYEIQRQMMNAQMVERMNVPSTVGTGLPGLIDGGQLRYPILQGLVNPVAITAPFESDAVARARTLLIEAIGAEAVARIEAGGGYPIKSGLWPSIVYVVPKTGKVMILKDGMVMGRSCIDVTGNVPWPDHVLTRIKAIQMDETVVFCTGNIS